MVPGRGSLNPTNIYTGCHNMIFSHSLDYHIIKASLFTTALKEQLRTTTYTSRRAASSKSPCQISQLNRAPVSSLSNRYVAEIATSTFSAQRRAYSQASGESKQRSIPASYYRGGTSRAPIFLTSDLPPDRKDWAPIFRSVLGSPDPNGRQLNGLGGGISSLSKICVVGPSSHLDADIDFTFVQVGIKDFVLDYSGNCGNLLAAVGPYAVDTGLVKPPMRDGDLTVRVHNTNTAKLIDVSFEVVDGDAATGGHFAIDGVAGTGSKISLSFLDPAGAKTGKLLPTGRAVDIIDGIRTTLIDCSNPAVFLKAEDLGVEGTILPAQMEKDKELLGRLEGIRREAAVRMGLCEAPNEAPLANPRIMFVSRAKDHLLLTGKEAKEEDVDIVVRTVSSGDPHKAVPITVALAVGASARLEGSVVKEVLGEGRVSGDGLTIGHASGKMLVDASFDGKGRITKATVFRTARRIMRGDVFWS